MPVVPDLHLPQIAARKHKPHVHPVASSRRTLGWPTTFIKLWMPKNRLHLCARTTIAMHAAEGNAFTRKSMRAVGTMLPSGLPDLREPERQDAVVVAKLLTDDGKVYRTATEFAAAIEVVST